jgi:AcrR family transcriptional regulator
VATASTPTPRRRRAPEEARSEILDAAEKLLREHRWADLRVDEVMSQTTLSRPSFWFYFEDRFELLVGLMQRFFERITAQSSQRWYEADDDVWTAGRDAIGELVAIYVEHGPVLLAMTDAARQDPKVERLYRAFIERFVERAAERIERDIDAGRTAPLDAREAAEALTLMNHSYLLERFGHGARADPEQISETLFDLWSRVLYRNES